jgi:Tol biopolymer transport system component
MSYVDTDVSSRDNYLSGQNYRPHFIRWSPDGSRILFFALYFIGASINADGNPLLDVDPETGKIRVLSKGWRSYDGKPVDMMMYDDTIVFSPDGSTLLLVIGAGRFPFEEKRIASMSWPDGKRKWLTQADSACRLPSWSPDGKQIAFIGNPETDHEGLEIDYAEKLARSRLFVMSADGSKLRQITGDSGYRDDEPRWVNARTLRFTRTANSSFEGRIDWDGNRTEWEVATDGCRLRFLRELPKAD